MTTAVFWAIIVPYLVYRAAWMVLRSYFVNTTTVLNDLELLRKTPSAQKVPGTAVIAGGSLAGYISARILVDYFEKIVIIEPEVDITLHGRASQRAHFHGFLSTSLIILRGLFSNFDEEAAKHEVYLLPPFRHWWMGNSYLGDLEAKRLHHVAGSRFSMENLCRHLSIAYCGENLQVIQGVVIDAEASSDEKTVCSVSFRRTSDDPQTISTIPCALLADCSGSSSIGMKLLPAASGAWGPFKRASYNPKAKYYSTTFRLSPETQESVSRSLPKRHPDFGEWEHCGIVGLVSPMIEKVGRELFGYQRIDGDRLLLLYGGWDVETCPRTIAQYVELAWQSYAKAFPKECHSRDEWFFNTLQVAGKGENLLDEPLKWDHYNLNSCSWNDYALKSIPNNFIAVGDSLMRVNPFFGQGVTKLLCNATILNSTLYKMLGKSTVPRAELPSGFSHTYFKRVLPIDKGMFDTTRMLDYGYKTTVPSAGDTLEFGAGFRKYWAALVNFVVHDAKAFVILDDVLCGYRPAIDLMSPSLILKSLFWMWWSPPKSVEE